MMAAIRKRGNKYEAQVRRKGFPSLTRSFHKLSDAREWARLMETKADRHELAPDKKILEQVRLSDLVKRYRDEVAVKKKGGEIEKIVLNAFLRQPLAQKPLSHLTVSDFAKYRDERLKVVSHATLKRQLTPLRHMFRHAKTEWHIPIAGSPLDDLTLNAPDLRRQRRLRRGEADRIRIASKRCRNPLVFTIIELALETAMRRGEILSLRWVDIDWERQLLVLQETKNGYSRTIPLTQRAFDLLANAKMRSNSDEYAESSSRIFPISPTAFGLAWRRLVRRAGINDLHFHDLRHEAISRLFEKGLTAPEVASISGHRDMRMLFRYAHANHEIVREKINDGLQTRTVALNRRVGTPSAGAGM